MRPTAAALRLMCLFIAVALVTGGCSFTRLGYQNMEWLVSWKLNDYVSLDREQKRWLRSEISDLHAWHCEAELPRYTTLLAGVRDDLLADRPDSAALQERFEGIQAEATRTLRKITPTLVILAASLSDEQVEELASNLAKQQLEHREEYTKPDLVTQNRERSKRMQKRMRRWLGPLEARQIERIDEWALQLEGGSQHWLDNRELWLITLREALEHRSSEDFAPRLQALLLTPQDFWTPSYAERQARSITRAAELLQDVATLATENQRQHLIRRTNAYMDDIARVRCPPTNG